MKKVIGLFAAPTGGDLEDAQEYWDGPFRTALLSMPEVADHLVKLVHTYARPISQRPDRAPNLEWTGVSEMWFDSGESAHDFIAAVNDHGVPGNHSAILPRMFFFRTDEIPMWDRAGPQNGPKVFHFFKPPSSMTKEQSLKYWNEQHVKVGEGMGTTNYVARYMQNHFIESSMPIDPQYDFIGSPELWFNSYEESLGTYKDESKNAVRAEDEDKFADRDATLTLVGEERVMPIG